MTPAAGSRASRVKTTRDEPREEGPRPRTGLGEDPLARDGRRTLLRGFPPRLIGKIALAGFLSMALAAGVYAYTGWSVPRPAYVKACAALFVWSLLAGLAPPPESSRHR